MIQSRAPAEAEVRSRAYDFAVSGEKCWAQAHLGSYPAVTLALRPLATLGVSLRMSPADARAMAIALEAAATHAENTLPSGLGESAAA